MASATDLINAEKAEWESIDWGDHNGVSRVPDAVQASAVNNWLVNTDTADKLLQHLMEEGLKVEGAGRLGKTIIFARNHDHAQFIEERFNFHYPHHAGHSARVIDNHAKYPQSAPTFSGIAGKNRPTYKSKVNHFS